MDDMLTGNVESGLTPEDSSVDFDRFWRRFYEMPFRDKRLTLIGVLRFYLRSRLFDSRDPVVLARSVVIGKRRPARLIVGCGVRIAKGCVLVVGTGREPESLLQIGPRTIVGPGTRIMAATQVRIGARCMISWNCSIFDSIGHKMWLKSTGESEIESPITIGDDVWIGPNSIIMKGVTLGSGSIVGAGSVVRRDVPPSSLVVGNPARVIDRVLKWER
jgi:acetyltransferase-like isoleucine patch superfamily enzyme